MCFSAIAVQSYKEFIRLFGATISYQEFYDLFWRRKQGAKIKVPRAMEDAFSNPENDDERAIKALIDEYRQDEVQRLEAEVFAQRTRLTKAERVLQAKPTKAAAESQRIATDKIERALARLNDMRRTEPRESDGRIFPMHYSLVMIEEDGVRRALPMRYHCRPHGKPATVDFRFAGLYNSRRDSLNKFWKELWGHKHALMLVSSFFENVDQHAAEGRELLAGEEKKNVVLHFQPQPRHLMLVACLWSRWTQAGEDDLLSFAAITDEPPAEVAAAGHDRCIVAIQPQNVDAWLKAEQTGLQGSDAILEDKAQIFYEHRMAA
jgi:putative SOS response-associated peptidase YedK